MSRILTICDRLVNEFVSVGAEAVVATKDEWGYLDEELGFARQFGYSWPIANPDFRTKGISPIRVYLCPEIIDAQTRDLTDEELNDYLNVIEYIINLHITYWAEKDPTVRQEKIDDQLWTEGPGSMQLLNEIQMKALS